MALRLSRSATVLISAAVVTCAFSVAALADNPPPGQVLSNFENHYGANIVQDCGYSQPLPADPGSSLWLFCDTDVYRFNAQGQWTLSDIISGSTAAEGPASPYQVPTGLSELSTPGSGVPAMPNHDGPAQFLPTPSGLVTSGGLPCDHANNAYAASWITGVTRDAARPSDVLISFNNYCAQSGGSFLAEGLGLAQYAPATRAGRRTRVTAQSAAGKCFNILQNFNNATLAHYLSIVETPNNFIGADVINDGEFHAAMRNWSACMARQGFHSSDADTFSQQAAIMLGQQTAPGRNPTGPPGQPTAAQNRTQVAMAVADANCTLSSDLSGIYFAVQASYEKQFVSANQQALGAGIREYKAAFAKGIKTMPALLRTTSATPNLVGPARHGHHGTAKPSPSHS